MSAETQSSHANKHSSALSNYVSNNEYFNKKKSVDLASSSYSFNTHYKVNHRSDQRRKRAAIAESSKAEECQQFVEGNGEKRTLYSPKYPSFYPNNTDCVHVIEG